VGPSARLEWKRKAPKEVAYETDIYTLPPGGVANGLTGDQLEATLASEVDARFTSMVATVPVQSGIVGDVTVERNIKWLMKTFAARSPESIRRVERGLAEFVSANAAVIDKLMTRASTQASREDLSKYRDARLPMVAARAGAASVVTGDLPRDLRWLDGELHVVRAEHVRSSLTSIGAGEFATFEDPVVVWDRNDVGVVASFALSPTAMMLVVEVGRCLVPAEYAHTAVQHCLAPLMFRQSLFCRTEAAGTLLAAAHRLRPRQNGDAT
jgi:hypothetical protein